MKYGLKKWADYVLDPSKCDPTSIDNYDPIKNNYYYSDATAFLTEEEECFGFSDSGDIEIRRDITKRKIPESGVFWKLMISFPPDFAINNGLISKYDYYELLKNVMPSLFADAGFKIDNMVWYAVLHRNTKNPHMHIAFYQKENHYKSKTISMMAINRLKSNIANYLISNTDFYKEKDFYFRDIVGSISYEEFAKIKSPKFFTNSFRRKLNEMLFDLYSKLPPVGRLQYNSRNMKPYKEEIDSIIEFILSHDSLKYKFADYDLLLQKHQKKLTEVYGQTKDNKSKKYYKDQINRLYSKIGNDILSGFKIYQSGDKLEKEKEFLKKNINKFNFKSRNDYVQETTKEDIAKDLYKICKFANLNDIQTKKIINKWNNNSNYNLDITNLFASFKNIKYDMSTTDYYKALRRLGYNFDRYSKIKNKNFYRELNYKKFFSNALNHLMYEIEKEEKELEEELRYELEIR